MSIIKYRSVLLFFVILLVGCQGTSMKEAAKLNQYMVQGMTLYRQHCANCHQTDGSGLAKLIPPLRNADYLDNLEPDDFACQIRYGLKGEIQVNGVTFNDQMPGIPKLTPLEIAEIITYVNNTWSSNKGIYDVKKAEKALNACSMTQ